MKPLPLPLRVAAGLVATAADKARELPKTVTGLPITVASQALQLSMRVQQQVTEMAIRGDDALSALRPVEETPEWATFDEDAEPAPATRGRTNGRSAWESATGWDTPSAWDSADEAAGPTEEDGPELGDDPWAREERAVAAAADRNPGPETNPAPGRGAAGLVAVDAGTSAGQDDPPTACPEYPELSIAQLRGRLRGFSVPQLRALLDYERAHQNRDEFTSMLSRRIDTVRAKQ